MVREHAHISLSHHSCRGEHRDFEFGPSGTTQCQKEAACC
jgi:hypothetical protein